MHYQHATSTAFLLPPRCASRSPWVRDEKRPIVWTSKARQLIAQHYAAEIQAMEDLPYAEMRSKAIVP